MREKACKKILYLVIFVLSLSVCVSPTAIYAAETVVDSKDADSNGIKNKLNNVSEPSLPFAVSIKNSENLNIFKVPAMGNVTAEYSGAEDNPAIILAGYDENGRYVCSNMGTAETPPSLDVSGMKLDRVRAFAWDSIESTKPIAEYDEITSDWYQIFDYNNITQISASGLEASTENVKRGDYSGLWDTQGLIEFKNIPEDLSVYNTLELDIYNTVSDKSITLKLISPNSGNVLNYHSVELNLDPSGWQHLSVALVSGENGVIKTGDKGDLTNIDSMQLLRDNTVRGEVYIGDIYLAASGSAKPKTFLEQTQEEYSVKSRNTVSLYSGSDYACLDGRRVKMSARAITYNDKIYAPISFFKNLNLNVGSEITQNGIEYADAQMILETKYSDTYKNGQFIIAGNDVSAFKNNTELYRYAAYEICYSTLDDITFDDSVFAELHKKWLDSLLGTSEEQKNSLVASKISDIEKNANSMSARMDDLDTFWTSKQTLVGLQASDYYGRVKTMAKGYATEAASTYKSEELKTKIVSALDYLYDNYYGKAIVETPDDKTKPWKTENWFYWKIQIPLDVVDILIMMGDSLSQEQIDKYLAPTNILTREPINTGANKIWTAQIVLAAGVLQKDARKLVMARDAIATEVNYKTKADSDKAYLADGLYEDGSYLMHDGYGYNLGYATRFLEYLQKVVPIVKNTQFGILDPDVENMDEWIELVYYPFVYKGIGTNITSGRSYERDDVVEDIGTRVITRMIDYARNTGGAKGEKLKSLIKYHCLNSPLNTNDKYYRSMLGISDLIYYDSLMNDANVLPVSPGNYTKFYYNMEKGISHGTDYMFALNMSSKRVKKYEAFSGDNNRGWYQGDGATYMNLDGLDMYSGSYFQNVDANKLPGTTVDGVDRVEKDFEGTESDKLLGENDFSGGVTLDGQENMVAAMQHIGYNSNGAVTDEPTSTLKAKKAYFAFDNEIVMLGSEITSQDNRNVITVVDNRDMSDSQTMTVNDTLWSGEIAETADINSKWYASFAEKAGYYIFDGATATVSKSSNNYMELQINHGVNPQGATYGYVWLPNRTSEQTKAYADNPEFEVLSNTATVQAVKDTVNNITGYVFWNAGSVNGLTADKPCIIMTKETDSELIVSICEPTRLSKSVNLNIDRADLTATNYDSEITASKSGGTTNINLTLDELDNGKTYTIRFSK